MVMTRRFCPVANDRYLISLAESLYLSLEELGAPLIGIEEEERCVGPTGDQHQSWQPSTGTKIDNRARRAAQLGLDSSHEPKCVVDLVVDRHWSQKSQLSRAKQLGLDRTADPVTDLIADLKQVRVVRALWHALPPPGLPAA